MIEIYQDEIQELIAGVPYGSLLQIAIRCVRRAALSGWKEHAPNDPSLQKAVADVAKVMDGRTQKIKILKWKPILKECHEQACDAFEDSVRRTKYRTLREVPPHGVAAYKAEWSASAVSSLLMLAVEDEQTDDVEEWGGLQKLREMLFGEVVAYSWEATNCDDKERRWQLKTISKMTGRKIPTRIQNRSNELEWHSSRSDYYFWAGLFEFAVIEYGWMIEIDPKLKASHWRRGVAFFYAGRYREAAKQFEAYRPPDNVDCESGIWRYLCQRKANSPKKARAGLHKFNKVDQEPFPDIYRLCAGEAKPNEILKRIESAKIPPAKRNRRRYYAELYIGLYEFVEGRTKSARTHLENAAVYTKAPEAGFGPNFKLADVAPDEGRSALARQQKNFARMSLQYLLAKKKKS